MKTVANRLIVFAASALAFGTVAFGQSRMTAEIPFAFHTASGTLPAGTYRFSEVTLNGIQHLVYVQNTATLEANAAGVPVLDLWYKAGKPGTSVDFVCRSGSCSLKAIRMSGEALVYSVPGARKNKESAMAIVSVPLKVSNGD